MNWVVVGRIGDLPEGGVIAFEHGADSFAVYHSKSGYYATDGFCTHQGSHLSAGLLLDDVIECQLHQGRFDIRTGQPLSPPACVALKTYPVRIDGDQVLLGLPGR